MSTASESSVPPTREFTAVWASYALFAIGIFLWWPALIGAIVCIAKRGAPGASFIDAHYGWLTRTFGWSLLGYGVSIGIILSSAWPLVQQIAAAVDESGGHWKSGMSINLDWGSIFLTAGVASAGVIALVCVWLWFIYRVVRGAFRLAAAQPVP